MDHLQKFRDAHKHYFQKALSEIRSGQKRSHWMWFIFPQIEGLGRSETAKFYSIKNRSEAEDFLNDPMLGRNYLQICEALLQLETSDATAVFGFPDDMKLKSSLTLFASVPDASEIFGKLLLKFFNGEKDNLTLSKLS